jgi:hypothetical protein
MKSSRSFTTVGLLYDIVAKRAFPFGADPRAGFFEKFIVGGADRSSATLLGQLDDCCTTMNHSYLVDAIVVRRRSEP